MINTIENGNAQNVTSKCFQVVIRVCINAVCNRENVKDVEGGYTRSHTLKAPFENIKFTRENHKNGSMRKTMTFEAPRLSQHFLLNMRWE